MSSVSPANDNDVFAGLTRRLCGAIVVEISHEFRVIHFLSEYNANLGTTRVLLNVHLIGTNANFPLSRVAARRINRTRAEWKPIAGIVREMKSALKIARNYVKEIHLRAASSNLLARGQTAGHRSLKINYFLPSRTFYPSSTRLRKRVVSMRNGTCANRSPTSIRGSFIKQPFIE